MELHLYLVVMIGLSSSGMYRLVVLSRLSLAIHTGSSLSPSQQTPLQLPQGLVIKQFVCGTSRQGCAIILFSSRRRLCIMLYSHPKTLNTSCPDLIARFGSGMQMVTKSDLHLMAGMLLSPQMVPSLFLFHTIEEPSQFTIPTLEQLLPSSRLLRGPVDAASPISLAKVKGYVLGVKETSKHRITCKPEAILSGECQLKCPT